MRHRDEEVEARPWEMESPLKGVGVGGLRGTGLLPQAGRLSTLAATTLLTGSLFRLDAIGVPC